MKFGTRQTWVRVLCELITWASYLSSPVLFFSLQNLDYM